MTEQEGCLACDLSSGRRALPGGRIYQTEQWVVEHCIGPLPIGTLILKPLRHCVAIADLTPAEATELGPLLRSACSVITQLTAPDQVYACLWSHAGWTPGHIHFVLQPAWGSQSDKYERPGPFMQTAMFAGEEAPDATEREEFAERARSAFRRTADAAD